MTSGVVLSGNCQASDPALQTFDMRGYGRLIQFTDKNIDLAQRVNDLIVSFNRVYSMWCTPGGNLSIQYYWDASQVTYHCYSKGFCPVIYHITSNDSGGFDGWERATELKNALYGEWTFQAINHQITDRLDEICSLIKNLCKEKYSMDAFQSAQFGRFTIHAKLNIKNGMVNTENLHFEFQFASREAALPFTEFESQLYDKSTKIY